MSKEQSPAFQFYAAEYLADINVQCMSLQEEGMYTRMLAYCWREGSLPKDPRLLQALCKGMAPSPLVLSCFVEKNGRLIHTRLEKERDKQKKWRLQKSEDGKKGATARWKKVNPLDGKAMAGPLEHTMAGPMANDSSSVCSLQSATEASPSASVPHTRTPDLLYDYFISSYKKTTNASYVSGKGDFVQLAALRKAHGTNGKGLVPNWEAGVDNYLASPMSKHTLADLCTRFGDFVRSPHNTFGRPVTATRDSELHSLNQQTFKTFVAKGKADDG